MKEKLVKGGFIGRTFGTTERGGASSRPQIETDIPEPIRRGK